MLVLGHTGRLGRAVRAALGDEALVVEPGPRDAAGRHTPEALAAHLAAIRRVIDQQRPSAVFNCLAWTNVDEAEARPEAAAAVNADLPEALAQACAAAGTRLVHVSTDFVFDGAARRPYKEADAPNPVNAYGRGKLAGERRVLAAQPDALVARVAWLFGPGPAGFVEKIVAAVRAGRPVRVVDDQVGSPTYTLDAAQALVDLARRGVHGLVHVVNQGQTTRRELARRAVALAGLSPDAVAAVGTAEFGAPAPRPAYSALDTSRLRRLLGQGLPTWLDAMGRYIASAEFEAGEGGS